VPGISIHVVDVARGKPASGMFVEVHALDDDIRRVVGTGCIGDDGTFSHQMNAGAGVQGGVHEVLLHAGDYFRLVGLVRDKPAFQEIVPPYVLASPPAAQLARRQRRSIALSSSSSLGGFARKSPAGTGRFSP